MLTRPLSTAKFGGRFGDNAVAFVWIGDVAPDCERFPAPGLDLALERERRRLARMIADRDPGPLLGEAQRHRRSDAGGPARDENRLAGEIGNDNSG